MKDYFSYNGGEGILPKDSFRISPSQLSRFFDQTSQWYSEYLLGNKPEFQGNTATYLGTCIHAAAEMYTNENKIHYDQIDSYINSIKDYEVDKYTIREQYPIMIETLITEYLAKQNDSSPLTELFVYHEILPGIFPSGSVDRYSKKLGGCITDYKSMGSLDSARVPTSFPRAYYFQQLTYAYLMRKQGYKVSTCELVYISRANTGRYSEKTGKRMKDYPSQVNTLTYDIKDDDMEFIESILLLIAESVQAWNKHPELRHIISQDYRNKIKTYPKFIK